MAKSKSTVKKSFYEVTAPLTSSKISLYGESPEQLNGRIVKLDLTRSLKGKSLELKFRIKSENGALGGEPISIQLAQSYVRRMMRKGADYVEDSFKAASKDFDTTVKVFMITRNRVSRTVRNSLRIEARKFLESYVKTRTAKELFSEITANKIQRELSYKLKKIYPLALCEIRVFEIEEGKANNQASESAAAAA